MGCHDHSLPTHRHGHSWLEIAAGDDVRRGWWRWRDGEEGESQVSRDPSSDEMIERFAGLLVTV